MPDQPERTDRKTIPGPTIEIAWLGGNCPVQAEGKINGTEFYFRARGDSWSLQVGGKDIVRNPEWRYEEGYGDGPFDAGWMTESEARGYIDKAARMYAER